MRRERPALFTLLMLSTGLALLSIDWLGHDLRTFGTVLIGDQGDTLINSWALYQALDNLLRRPWTELGYAPIFYDDPAPFATTIAPYGIALQTLPLYLLSGGNLPLTYNTYLLMTFPLTALAAYGLARIVTGAPPIIAGFAALLVAFAPYRYLYLAGIETLSPHTLLFALLCLHLTLIRRQNVRFGSLTGAAFFITFTTSGYLGVYFAWMAAVIVGAAALRRALSRRAFIGLVVAAAVGLSLSAPFMLWRYANPAFRAPLPYWEKVRNSAALDHLLVGSSAFWLNVIETPPPVGAQIRLMQGAVVTALAVMGCTMVWRVPGKSVRPYALIFALGFVLAVGPELRPRANDLSGLPTPYRLLFDLPGLDKLRSPSRYATLSMIAGPVLAAYALSRWRQRHRFVLILALVSVLAFVETVPPNRNRVPYIALERARRRYVTTYRNPPRTLYAWLASQPRDTVVLHLPADEAFQYTADLPLHNRPMLNGEASLRPAWYAQTGWDAFPDMATMVHVLERGADYVFVHTRYLSDDEYADLTARIAGEPRLGEPARFDDVDVYLVLPGAGE